MGPGTQGSTGKRSRTRAKTHRWNSYPEGTGPAGRERREASLEGTCVRSMLPELCVNHPVLRPTEVHPRQLFSSLFHPAKDLSTPEPYQSLQDHTGNTMRPPLEHRDVRGRREWGVLPCAKQVSPHLAAGPYHTEGQQTAADPAWQVGTVNPSSRRQAEEQQQQRQKQGCRSGAPHELLQDQDTGTMALLSAGGQQGLALEL